MAFASVQKQASEKRALRKKRKALEVSEAAAVAVAGPQV